MWWITIAGRSNPMRTTCLICLLALLLGCSRTPEQRTNDPGPPGPNEAPPQPAPAEPAARPDKQPPQDPKTDFSWLTLWLGDDHSISFGPEWATEIWWTDDGELDPKKGIIRRRKINLKLHAKLPACGQIFAL